VPGIINLLEKKLLIKPGERGKVLYFLLFFMLVSAGMAIGRSTADALFLKRLGIEYLPLMYIIQGMMLAAVSMVYAAFADRIPAEKFFRALFAVLILLVFASWTAMSASSNSLVYPAYYLVYEVASEILLIHTALYMNQNMTTIQTKRLAPLVYAGAQVGTIIGGLLLVIAAPAFGARNLLLLWCALLLAGAIAINIRHKKHGTSTHFRTPKKSRHLMKDCIEQVQQGIKFTYRSSLLRAASLALFFMVLAFYILCYSVNRIYTQTFDTEESLTRFFGLLTATTSVIALFMQLFVTNRAIKHFGVRTINLLFPATTLICLIALTFSFTLPAALLGSINKDSLMPAFRNPVRSMFFNALPAYMQGRARAMSIALVLPLALMGGGVILMLMQNMNTPVYFLVFGIFAASLYLFYSRQMNKTYVGTLLATLKERLFLPDKHMYSDLQGGGEQTLKEIMRGINNADEEVSVAFAKVLVGAFPKKAAAIILERAGHMETATADRALSLLAPLELSAYTDELQRLASNGDSHLQTTVMRLLLDKNHKASITEAVAQLHSSNPRMLSTAIHAALRYPDAHNDRNRAIAAWQSLLQSNTASRCAAMENMQDLALLGSPERQSLLPDYLDAFISLLADASEHTSLRALQGLQQWKEAITPELAQAVIQATASENPQLREAAVGCLHLINDEQRNKLIINAIGDGHIRVRKAGIAVLRAVSKDYNKSALQWISGNQASLRAQNTLMSSLMGAHLPASTYEEIAQIKSGEILLLQDALAILEQDNETAVNSARPLLQYTLKEQLDQTIELVLLALESLYDKETIKIIHAGFTCGDSRHIANACEVLGNLVKGSSICNLCDALLRASGEDPGHWKPPFAGVDDVLQWCANHGNHWLSECGKQALQPAGKFNA
jgi:predicted Fe-Mo cluster-binding NifX family protein